MLLHGCLRGQVNDGGKDADCSNADRHGAGLPQHREKRHAGTAQSRPKHHKKNYILCFCGGLKNLSMDKKKNLNNDERHKAAHPSKHAGLTKLPQVNPQLYPQARGLAIPQTPHYLVSQRQ
ncbi:hypothetical protein P8H27_09870 [Pseudomonas sp. sp1636]|uniref:hypothetical protein n=1 Tax=Pseudomonas sp. sp1636 TaxID=3036707 RepID=UPI0025A5FDB5|nr:hypothetical protein [Pseudomonas sp. sp1636]MDM8349207.1 hypothetical protein [Pseudomonas sp. sp1636]